MLFAGCSRHAEPEPALLTLEKEIVLPCSTISVLEANETRTRRSEKNTRRVAGRWQLLHFKVIFDGKVALEGTDDTFKKVGVWTKADSSVTLFDELGYGSK
jgi:hypothetical protein